MLTRRLKEDNKRAISEGLREFFTRWIAALSVIPYEDQVSGISDEELKSGWNQYFQRYDWWVRNQAEVEHRLVRKK